MQVITDKIVDYIEAAKIIARDTGCGIKMGYNHNTKKEFEAQDVRVVIEIAKMIERMDKNATV